jgi:hypothetical protein
MPGEELNDPLIGAKLGPCRIEVRLAAGGMGVVYRAEHLVLKEPVAVKVLAASLAQDQEYVTRFFREAGAAGSIDHPNVVRVIDVGRQDDRYYLVMEYVQGETLDQIIERDRRIPLDQATRQLRQIAAGLAAAHRSGTIHRDVKPGNVIVSPDGVCHLTDFGLARQASQNSRKGLTIEGTFLGTPEYASPEQVEGKKLDHRTDLYSLGVTYYHMLSGTLPFLGESAMEIAIKRTREDPRPLEQALPGADPRAAATIRKLLQREAVQRYQSATDLIKDLDVILSGPAKAEKLRTSETTKKIGNVLHVARSRRRLRMVLHWTLVLAAVALGFCSGAGAPRGGHWLQDDSGKGGRVGMLVAGLVLALASQAVYAKEFSGWGRRILVALLDLAQVGLALLAGLWLGTAAPGIPASLGFLGERLSSPPNLLAVAALGLVVGAQIPFEQETGSHRIWISRSLLLTAFLFSYLFGLGRMDPGAVFGRFIDVAEIAVPVGTGGVLAAVFGLIMVTGYDYEAPTRWGGIALSLIACGLFFAFPLLVGQPSQTEGWRVLLSEPFKGIVASARESGTLLVGTLFAGALERAVAHAGMKAQERSLRRRF